MDEVNKWIITVISVSFAAGLIKKLFPDKKNAALELMLSLVIMIAIISPLVRLQSGIDISSLDFSESNGSGAAFYEDYEKIYLEKMTERTKGAIEKKVKESFFKMTGVAPKKVYVELETDELSQVTVKSIKIDAPLKKESFNEAALKIGRDFECEDTGFV